MKSHKSFVSSVAVALVLWASASALTTQVYAHEGSHDVPGNVVLGKPGAISRTTEDGHFGLVRKADPQKRQDQLELYFFSLDEVNTPKPIEGISLKAKLTLPGNKKPTPLEFKPSGDHWSASVSTQGIHRYTINIHVQMKTASHKIQYTLEPKR